MASARVAIIGAGIGGLAAAVDLARQGVAVTVLEKSAQVGGKIRQDRAGIESGPTALTMRWVLDALFVDAGTTPDAHLTLRQADLLARHAWGETERLDLFADQARSIDAIAAFTGPTEARGYAAFCRRAQHMFQLQEPFLRARPPSILSLAARLRGLPSFPTLSRELSRHFRDRRLRQLFGQYAACSGSSPFQAPATLMLTAHIQQAGVWLVDGGMTRLAQALADLATGFGAVIRCNAPVAEVTAHDGRASGVILVGGERIGADAVICNADAAALAAGALGRATKGAVRAPKRDLRSLSAFTWGMVAETEGFPLARDTIFFGSDDRAEFDAIFRKGQIAEEPTVIVCAQDRPAEARTRIAGAEHLFMRIHAPADGDRRVASAQDIEQWSARMFALLRRRGLAVRPWPETVSVTTPTDFAHLFPATGGALYGQAVHGSLAPFRRPGARSALPGLYLAGGSVHPGPGVPFAILSGRLAAESVLQDLPSRHA